jgi:hypothetical protein
VSERDRVCGVVRRALAARSWSIDVPAGWEHETEDTLDTFFDPDGVGALQISSLTKGGGDVTDAELIESIEDMKLAECPRVAAAFGPFTGYALEKLHDDGQAGRYWFLRAGPLLLFVTYFCDRQDAGKEARIVEKSLNTLRLAAG